MHGHYTVATGALVAAVVLIVCGFSLLALSIACSDRENTAHHRAAPVHWRDEEPDTSSVLIHAMDSVSRMRNSYQPFPPQYAEQYI